MGCREFVPILHGRVGAVELVAVVVRIGYETGNLIADVGVIIRGLGLARDRLGNVVVIAPGFFVGPFERLGIGQPGEQPDVFLAGYVLEDLAIFVPHALYLMPRNSRPASGLGQDSIPNSCFGLENCGVMRRSSGWRCGKGLSRKRPRAGPAVIPGEAALAVLASKAASPEVELHCRWHYCCGGGALSPCPSW